MTQLRQFIKTPSEDLRYGFEWENWLPDGSSISSVTWIVDVGLLDSLPNVTGTQSSILLGGGVPETTYQATCEMLPSDGQQKAIRSFEIRVVEARSD